jgi:hypothetical protein
MSTLTGNDVYGLMEAYQAVYAPQELTEEKVWEEVEEWVNTLIEEGYDLSDYTWEEMFEAYIDEQGRPGSAAVRNQNVNPNAYSAIKSAANSTIGSTPIGFAVRNMASQPPAPPGTGARRGAAPRPQAPSIRDGRNSPPSQQVKFSTPTPSPARTPAPAARTPGVTPAAKPAAPTPAARPAAPAPAKPAGTTPTAKPTPAPSASPARPSLSSQADEIRKMRAGSLARQGRTLDAATVSGTTKPAYQANSFDPFDVIKGHLLDEGYADTEEAALVIMANMSEEWRESIVEGDNYEKNRRAAARRAEARNAARDAGQTGIVPGVGYVSPRREKISLRDKFGDAAGTRMAKAKPPSGDEKH